MIINKNVERRETDFGFVLLTPDSSKTAGDGYTFELFGMTGIGRFEMFSSCGCSAEDEFEDLLAESLEEHEDDVFVYMKTKKALG